MANVKPRYSCRSLFKRLEILTVPYVYIFSSMIFIVNNQEYVQSNSTLHSVNTRNRHDLANLSCFQKVHATLASKFSAVYHAVKNSL
jgi:hypothetical protein